MSDLRGSHTPETTGSPLHGQSAVVSGGSGGIGLAVARELDRQGCRTVIAGRDAERIRAAAEQLPLGLGFGNCDVRSAEAVEELFAFAQRELGRIDLVICAAGIGQAARTARPIPDAVHALEIDEWDEVVDTNLRGMFLQCRQAARVMVAQRSGQIVNISSARAAVRGQPCAAAYSASKMAALAMCQSLAEEVRPFGVRVISLLPDAVDTSLIAGSRLARRGAMSPDSLAQFVAEVVSLPMDVTFESPLLAPFRSKRSATVAAETN